MSALLALGLLVTAACTGDAAKTRTPLPLGTGAAGVSPPPAPLASFGLADNPTPPSASLTGPQPSAASARPPQQFAEPPPERTGVVFEWPETDPAESVACKSGHYVGEYQCRLFIIQTEGQGAFDVAGTVDLQLEQSTEGEFLRVRNGKFTSATLAAIPVQADLVGELDCSASKFEGRLENGKFSVALGLPVPFTEGTFSGPLVATYDAASSALSGTWNMTGELDGFPGSCMNGSWSATWRD